MSNHGDTDQSSGAGFPIAEMIAAIIFAIALIVVIVVMINARPAVSPPADHVPRMTGSGQIK